MGSVELIMPPKCLEPRMPLLESRDAEEWSDWKQVFGREVLNNEELSPKKKFIYLLYSVNSLGRCTPLSRRSRKLQAGL